MSRAAAAVAVVVAVAAAALVAWLALSGAGQAPAVSFAAQRPTIVAEDRLLLGGSASEAEAAARQIRALGARWARVTASWAAIDAAAARAAPSVPRDARLYTHAAWASLDRAVGTLERSGLTVMIDLAGPAPEWARGSADLAHARHFARFAGTVAGRYANRPPRLPAVGAYTIWSEPNRSGSLTPAAGATREPRALADRYREMVAAAAHAIRRAAPRSLVLIGAAAPSAGHGPGGVAPLRFLGDLACLEASGAPRRSGTCARFRPLPGDGWAQSLRTSATPAPWLPAAGGDDVGPADLGRLTAALARLHRAGRLRRPLHRAVYVTSHSFEPADAGPYRHARWLAEAERLARLTPGVRSFAQAPLRDAPGLAAAGLTAADAKPKPALAAFAYPMVVRRAGPRRVLIWGRVRPPAQRGRFRIAVRTTPGGDWSVLPQFNRPRRTAADGGFTVDASTIFGGVALDPGATFRLELQHDGGWRPAGLPILGAR